MATPRITAVAAGADILAAAQLDRVDYSDGFRVDAAVERDASQWANAVLLDAPKPVRVQLACGWMSMGLNIEPWRESRVLGWAVQSRSAEQLVLRADSRLGLRARLVFTHAPGGFSFATVIGLRHRGAAIGWALITPTHLRVVRSLLLAAARRELRAQERVTPS